VCYQRSRMCSILKVRTVTHGRGIRVVRRVSGLILYTLEGFCVLGCIGGTGTNRHGPCGDHGHVEHARERYGAKHSSEACEAQREWTVRAHGAALGPGTVSSVLPTIWVPTG
jgi:hypothetical protein